MKYRTLSRLVWAFIILFCLVIGISDAIINNHFPKSEAIVLGFSLLVLVTDYLSGK